MIENVIDAIQKIVYNPYEDAKRVNKDKLVLIETHEDAKCKEITLQLTKGRKILVYKFDQVVRDENNKDIKDPLVLFEALPPIRSKCDYIVFYHHITKKNEMLCVAICNMKSEKKNNMEDQMLAGKDLSEYILKTAIRCLNSWNSNTEDYENIDYDSFKKDYVKFKEIGIYSKIPSSEIQKGTTKPKKRDNKRKNIECNKEYDFEIIIMS